MTTDPSESPPPTRRLLIVDGDPLILKVIHEFFDPNGYSVDEAADGALALARLDEAVPDIIVAELLLAELDGWELFETIRARPATARVPFVFLTAESDLPQRLRAFHMGADDYVTKPFDVEELHGRVERILQRQEEAAAWDSSAATLLSGSVRHMSLSDLLQILALNGKDGTVLLRQGGEGGTIVLSGGAMVHAVCGRVRGVKALYRMLGWAAATFRVLPPGSGEVPRSIDQPTTSVLMDGLVSLDEWNRWNGMLPEADAILEVAPDANDRLGGRRLAPAESDVIERARGGAIVADILEASPLPDADLAEAMCGLISNGVLHARI